MRSSIAIAAGLAAVASAKSYTVTDTVDVTITSCAPTVTDCAYDPVDPAATTTDGSWDDWGSSTTTIPVDPVSTSTGTWADWESSSTSTPVDPVSTSTGTWADWESTTSTPVDPVSTSTGTWADWESATTPVAVVVTSTSTGDCGAYTATGVPEWFSLLPADQLSSLAAEWTGTAAPADWCYYTYSTEIPTSTSTPVAPVSTGSGTWPVAGESTAAAATTGAWAYTSSSDVSPAAYTGAASANRAGAAIAGLAAVAAMVIA